MMKSPSRYNIYVMSFKDFSFLQHKLLRNAEIFHSSKYLSETKTSFAPPPIPVTGISVWLEDAVMLNDTYYYYYLLQCFPAGVCPSVLENFEILREQ